MSVETIEKIKIGDVTVYLEDYEYGKGKIMITGLVYDKAYTTYWGAMGNDLRRFIKSIDPDYFANRLAPPDKVVDVKGTFKNVRKQIKELMPWYNHIEFQKDMREKLKEFQYDVEQNPDERFFVYEFSGFMDSLDMYLIDDEYDRKVFKSLQDECWYYLETKPGPEYDALYKFHAKLINELNKNHDQRATENT